LNCPVIPAMASNLHITLSKLSPIL
jgi:hypothetical protein